MVEPRVSHVLDKCCVTEPHPQSCHTQFCFVLFFMLFYTPSGVWQNKVVFRLSTAVSTSFLVQVPTSSLKMLVFSNPRVSGCSEIIKCGPSFLVSNDMTRALSIPMPWIC